MTKMSSARNVVCAKWWHDKVQNGNVKILILKRQEK